MKYQKHITLRDIVKLVAIAFIIVVFVIPYGKVEYYTAKYGDIFAERYKDIGYITSSCRYKVMEYSGERATVYYVPEERDMGVRIRFKNNYGTWRLAGWDCVWSKSGSADGIIWPYYYL